MLFLVDNGDIGYQLFKIWPLSGELSLGNLALPSR